MGRLLSANVPFLSLSLEDAVGGPEGLAPGAGVHWGLSAPTLWFTDSGICLENGVYAAAVMPGSPAAKEGSLAVGDRIVAVSLGPRRLSHVGS